MLTNAMASPLPKPLPRPWNVPSANPCGACPARARSVCNAIPEDGLDRLAAASTRHAFPAGKTFVEEGDEATHLFNITSGVVKLYKLLVDGRRQIVGFLLPGDLLGLSFGGRYAYSAEAVTSVGACRFTRSRLNELLDEFPAMQRRLLGIAANELGAAQEQMVLLGRKSARERVASFLLTLARRARAVGLSTDPLALPMTRTDIADHLGLTIETVSRTLTQLKHEGTIALPRAGAARLLDRSALEAAAEGG